MSDPNPGSGVQPGNPAPSAPASPAAPAAPATPPWYQMEGMAPEQATQLGEVVKAKGWKHPAEALLSYTNLEKLMGADKAGRTILAPKDAEDAEGWNAIYDRLGRPKDPTGYKLPVPEGDDGALAKAMAPVLHKHGLTARQAEGLAGDWNTMMADMATAANEAYAAQTEAEYKALQSEWGAATKQNEELARRAVAKFGKDVGLNEDKMNALEKAIGTAPMLKMFHAIGASFAEGSFIDGKGGGDGAMTPAQAQAKINAKFGDTDFMGRYTNADPKIRQGAIDEMMALQRMANPQLMEQKPG